MPEKLPPIDRDNGDPNEKFKARNWKKKDIRKMNPQQRSRYMAYEEPSKEAVEAQSVSNKRLLDRKRNEMRINAPLPAEEYDEREKHAKLIGQLKAAESRNRLRIMRLRYQSNKSQEISHLIACQPTAAKAVRLQALVPSNPERRTRKDTLDKLSRERCERLLEDSQGLLVNRVH
ncbi:protein LKAAEAR1-like [Ylistrum balloti]|uniref:protein LKAAEAR1-like n=1 Tax=Ylistrum balloti TaxID=509963 RepID=UPI002905F724|nr:protein LKAAEAR1-like [Ylistrum balloti]